MNTEPLFPRNTNVLLGLLLLLPFTAIAQTVVVPNIVKPGVDWVSDHPAEVERSTSGVYYDYAWDPSCQLVTPPGCWTATPMTTQPTGSQAREESGEDWWFAHCNYTTSNFHNGYYTAGYSSWPNCSWHGEGCRPTIEAVITSATSHAPRPKELEKPNYRKGETRGVVAQYNLGGIRYWDRKLLPGQLFSVIQDSEENVIVVGESYANAWPDDMNTNDNLVIRINSDQNLDLNDDQQDCITYAGSPFLFGYVCKLSPSGDILWTRFLNSEPDLSNAIKTRSSMWDVVEVPGANGPEYMVVGRSSLYSENAGRPAMYRLDGDGELIGSHRYGPGAPNDWPSDDGGEFRAVTFSNGLLFANGYHFMGAIHALSMLVDPANGNFLPEWVLTTGDPGGDLVQIAGHSPTQVSHSTQGVFVDAGDVKIVWPTLANYGPGSIYGGVSVATLLVHGLDVDGNLLWTTNMGEVRAYDLMAGITATADGMVAIVSSVAGGNVVDGAPPNTWMPTATYDCTVNEFGYVPEGGDGVDWTDTDQYYYWDTDAFVAKLDPLTGNPIWAARWDMDEASTFECSYGDLRNQECLYRITEAEADGGLVISGNTSHNFDDYYLSKLEPECQASIDFEPFPLDDQGRHVLQANATWDTEMNVYGTIVVPDGVTLTIEDVIIRFADSDKLYWPTALVVEPGGRLFVQDNAELTSIEGCPSALWDGIRVEGTTSDYTQSMATQGQAFIQSDAVIANARVGVRAARLLPNGTADIEGYGGRIWATGATFRNCLTGIRIENFRRYGANPALELSNSSRIEGCTFITTSDWYDSEEDFPYAHVQLTNVKLMRLSDNIFLNEVPGMFPPNKQGWGIMAMNTIFQCRRGSMEGLSVGVMASTYSPLWSYMVDYVDFTNNGYGIVDFGSRGARLTNNNIVIWGEGPQAVEPQRYGIMLFQSEGYIVERNTFSSLDQTAPSLGITFLGDALGGNEVYNNTFNGVTVGSWVRGRQRHPDLDPLIAQGLQMRCGTHQDNTISHLFSDNAVVQMDQGLPGNVQWLTNNEFFSTPACELGELDEPAFHPFVLAFSNYDLFVNYHYYGHGSSPEQRPDCIEDENGDPISDMGAWFFDLIRHDQTLTFDKERDCAFGILDMEEEEETDVVELSEQYQNAITLLGSAWHNYRETVDLNERPDLIEAIQYEPWHPSHYLRDLLLAHHPLSDSVLAEAILRTEPMDPWHLTQVLIDNSDLSPKILQLLLEEETLPPYFDALLKDMQVGGSTRRVLEMEIVLRQHEKNLLQRRLLHTWAMDTVHTHKADSVLAILQADSIGDGRRATYQHYLGLHEFTQAASMAQEMVAEPWTEALAELGAMYHRAGGDWDLTTTAERADLQKMAFEHAPSAGAHAWAVLLVLNELDSIPMPVPSEGGAEKRIPRENKWRQERTLPTLGVLPNPASDRIVFTYGAGMEEGSLEILDTQGRLLRTIALNGRQGMVESDVLGWSEGLYAVRLILHGQSVAHAKFTVVR